MSVPKFHLRRAVLAAWTLSTLLALLTAATAIADGGKGGPW